MIKRILVANRGEIAVRIIRACRELGIEPIAVHSEADAGALHVAMADRSYCIGPARSSDSYLNVDALISVAARTGCDAIHPGVGFLSENASFARETEREGILFIGPRPETIELLGDKLRAKAAARERGLPATPGSSGPASDPDQALAVAEEVGYPVIVKAASGGGGKGMRIVRSSEGLAEAIALASREAAAAFDDGTVYIEKYIENPRHVELQLVGDGRGGVAVFGERDCSVQRRHQKLIEESPSPGLPETMRSAMRDRASALFSELRYRGAGTIEFLVKRDSFWFMEVNARIQVEHPVTEETTGADLVREQIVACAEGLLLTPSPECRGWAMEARINALAPGRVTRLRLPGGPGVRVDGFLDEGCVVSPHYDSMVAKVIARDTDRPRTIARLERALREMIVEGVPLNLSSQLAILADPVFRSGDFGTSFHERFEEAAHDR